MEMNQPDGTRFNRGCLNSFAQARATQRWRLGSSKIALVLVLSTLTINPYDKTCFRVAVVANVLPSASPLEHALYSEGNPFQTHEVARFLSPSFAGGGMRGRSMSPQPRWYSPGINIGHIDHKATDQCYGDGTSTRPRHARVTYALRRLE